MTVDKTGLPWLKGNLLAGAITSVCSAAFLLFGYDQGVMSGVIISDYWLQQMGNPSSVIVGTIVAVYDVGAVFGAILAATTAERLGRKRALMVGTVLLIIGSVLMGAAMEQVMMFCGRVFTGFGKLSCTMASLFYPNTARYWLHHIGCSSIPVGVLSTYSARLAALLPALLSARRSSDRVLDELRILLL